MQALAVRRLDRVERLPRRAERCAHRGAPLGVDLPHVITTPGRERPNRLLRVRDDGQRRGSEPTDLGGVAVHLQDRRAPCDPPVAQPRRVEAEAHTQRERDVRTLAFGKATELIQRAPVPIVVVGDRADRAVVGVARNACHLEELVARGAGGRVRGTAQQEHRAGRAREAVEKRSDAVRAGRRGSKDRRHVGGQRRVGVEDVGRDVEQNRAPRRRRRDADRLSHDAAELIDRVHLARPLADGCREADVVDADLQAVGLERRLGRRADHVDDRGAIEHRVRHRGEDIREPRTRAHGRDAERARQP